MSKKKQHSGLARYWGIPVALFALVGWFFPEVGPAWIVFASAVSLFYFCFQMPLPCGAWNRSPKGRCRNNANGFLPGCHIEHHRWQSAKFMITNGGWSELKEKTLASWKRSVPTLVAGATILSGVVGSAQLVVAIVTA